MKHILGPVLGFRSSTATAWNCCVLHVFDELQGAAPALKWKQGGTAKTTPGKSIYTHGTAQVWVYEIPARLLAAESSVSYELADGTGKAIYNVPKKSATPRMAYCSCNGFSDPKLARDLVNPVNRWEHLKATHEAQPAQPFHLLLMGGDQVYSDQMWANVPALAEWANKSRFFQTRSGFTAPMDTDVRQFFFDLYTVNWEIGRASCRERVCLAV